MTDVIAEAKPTRLTANGITIEVDLAEILTAIDPQGRYLGYDPNEDEDRYVQSSLQQEIVRACSLEMVKQIRKGLADDVAKAVHEEIQRNVAEIVRETLTEPVQKFTEYGSKIGEATPLRQIIAEQAEAALTKPQGDSYSRNKQTVVRQIIAEEISKAFKVELQEHVKTAKEAAVQAVKTSAAEVISETIDRARRGLA